MTKLRMPRLEPALAGLVTLGISGALLYELGVSGFLLFFYCFAVGLSVTAFRSAFLLPGYDEKLTPVQRSLNYALWLGATVAAFGGYMLLFYPTPA